MTPGGDQRSHSLDPACRHKCPGATCAHLVVFRRCLTGSNDKLIITNEGPSEILQKSRRRLQESQHFTRMDGRRTPGIDWDYS
jgi:hypothetical protein